MAAAIAARLRMSNRFTAYLGTLIRQHLRLGFLVREQPLTRRALARYRRDVSPWVFESVVVSLCDRLATRGEKTSLTSMARHYRVARSVWTAVGKAPVPQVLSGDEVMELLGLEPGRRRARPRTRSEEEIEAGEVSDADEARAFLLDWWTARRGRPRMPELPEVETVRRRLLTCLPGLLLAELVVNDASVSDQSRRSCALCSPAAASPACGGAAEIPARRPRRPGAEASRRRRHRPSPGRPSPSSTCA